MERFPRARVVTVDDAGHWVHADQPDRLVHVLENFLG
jgi:pimeloyl-ACP methyl ester carboxylesterase